MSLMCSATEYELQKTVSDFAKLSEQASREKASLKEEVSRPQWITCTCTHSCISIVCMRN